MPTTRYEIYVKGILSFVKFTKQDFSKFSKFKNFKKSSGAADVNVNHIRPDTWWDEYNNNDEHDNTILKYTPSIKNTLNSITHQDIYEPNTRN